MKNILVFGKTQASANRYLRKFASKRNDIKFWHGVTMLVLLNEDFYKAVGADDSSRGRRCNKAYVQNNITEDYIDYIVKPCFENEYDITYFKGD
jgi:hypothetical protein